MHFCFLVVTEEFPTDDVLEEALAPFNEESYYEKKTEQPEAEEPAFLWDWWTLGGRYAGLLRLDISGDNFEKYELKYMVDNPRNGRLFRSVLLEDDKRKVTDYSARGEHFKLCYMGFRDRLLYVDAASISDLKMYPDAYGLLLPDGTVMQRYRYEDGQFVTDNNYDEKAHEALNANRDCWVSVVDIHD